MQVLPVTDILMEKPKNTRAARGRPSAVNFNHVLIYVRNLDASLRFYRDLLGFRKVEEIPGDYARLRSAASESTLALHVTKSRATRRPGGVWLYFEVKELQRLYPRLRDAGVPFSQPPLRMPWGWVQAFLEDPDGHQLCLYWAGSRRLNASE
jgi:catechol 2,3-dioxygenase-like lactoylglutathione lyase family enzyme